MMDGIDLNWPQRDFSFEDACAAIAAGKQFAMIGRNPDNENAWIQRGHLQHAGMQHIGEYLESMDGTFPDFFPETTIVGFAVEKDSGYAGPDAVREVARRIIDAGKTAICYASLNSWREAGLADDWDELARMGVLLWCPGYHDDGQPRGLGLEQPFGGFSGKAIEQFFGGTDLGDGVQIPGRIPGIGYDIDLDQCDPSLWGVEAAPQPQETAAPAPLAPGAAGEEFGMLVPLDMQDSIALIDRINKAAGNWISDDGVGGAFEVLDTFNGQPIGDGVRVIALSFRQAALVATESAEPSA